MAGGGSSFRAYGLVDSKSSRGSRERTLAGPAPSIIDPLGFTGLGAPSTRRIISGCSLREWVSPLLVSDVLSGNRSAPVCSEDARREVRLRGSAKSVFGYPGPALRAAARTMFSQWMVNMRLSRDHLLKMNETGAPYLLRKTTSQDTRTFLARSDPCKQLQFVCERTGLPRHI